jgi:hypothetical protein
MMLQPPEYQSRYSVRFIDKLGDGKDGTVLQTSLGNAVKFFDSEELFRRELRASPDSSGSKY